MDNHIRTLRSARGWTQADLAVQLDVSRQTVNALETGRYDPSLPLAFRIGQVFGQPLEAIFVVDNSENSAPLAAQQTGWEEQVRPANAFNEEQIMAQLGAEGWELIGFGVGFLKFRRPTDLTPQNWAYQRLSGPLSAAAQQQMAQEGWSYVGSWLAIAFHYFKRPVG